ncbi:neuronal acetylcholine receptor subunit alpha-9-I-like [Haliotis asinina]|uniref:neuronal acetylcholine receptor subunit alpha-9-I-like n=1 Tax=Haliotis asinina TaxID=109174 RepID=UPI00353192DE
MLKRLLIGLNVQAVNRERKQTCEIEVGGWFGVYNRIHISRKADINIKQFEENSEFEIAIENITVKPSIRNQRLAITINLKRRPLFYIFTILLPVVLLHFLNSFVFLLPSQSGEKTSMAVSMLLSFQLFLSIIKDSLPENSLTASLFSLYVSLANFTSVVIVVVNILLLKMKENPSPKWIVRLCKKALHNVDTGSVSVEGEEETRPKWEDIETELNRTCFACFFVFSSGLTSVVIGMLTR